MGSTENEGTKEASGASTKVGYVALVVSMYGALEEMESLAKDRGMYRISLVWSDPAL